MDQAVLDQLMSAAERKDAALETASYMADHLRSFLKKGERVLICFSNERIGGLGWIMEQAVLQCGGVPMIWGPDYRWKSVMQQAFYSHAAVIMAPPLIVLGLCKLKKYTGLPLYIRHVVTAGYPCLDWMLDGIIKGLDCSVHGSFGFGETGIVAGFSCDKSRGVHLRQDVYDVMILDESGNPLPDGQVGEIFICSKSDPQLRLSVDDCGRRVTEACDCGNTDVRLVDIGPGKEKDPDLIALGESLHSWTSVLDCWLKRGSYGLEIEMIVFPGEKLPKLPSAAKQIIRPWDPKHDTPFYYAPTVKKPDFFLESH